MTALKLKPGTSARAQPPWTLVERQIDLVYSLALRRSVSLVGVQVESVEYLWTIRRWRRGGPRQAIFFRQAVTAVCRYAAPRADWPCRDDGTAFYGPQNFGTNPWRRPDLAPEQRDRDS